MRTPSGNVRSKLSIAEAAGAAYTRNADALRVVQPEDVLPGDIDAHLGAPWVPEGDIQAFAACLFGVSPETVQIAHLKKDAVWAGAGRYAELWDRDLWLKHSETTEDDKRDMAARLAELGL